MRAPYLPRRQLQTLRLRPRNTERQELKNMTTHSQTIATERRALVTANTLALQDKYYAERRLPEATPVGAEDRTFCFRVEFEHDLYPLTHMLRWATETWWSSPFCRNR